jgi:N-acetyl-gamma-glutamyl-phosphate reductase
MAHTCISVGIVGGSGFTGALLAELILKHPDAELASISSESVAGEAVAGHLPRLRTGLTFCHGSAIGDVDVAFVCCPHGEAAPVARRRLNDGTRVIDLSADFRLPHDVYAQCYGEHPSPELEPAVYGLTELHRREIAAAALVANPGCYPTAALLALTPLQPLGLEDIIIDAKSSVSGAGKTTGSRMQFCSVDSDLVAYGVGSHRHCPEIAMGLGINGSGPSLTFVPHLVPLQRGIVETIYVRAAELPSAADLRTRYADAYDAEPFVEISAAPPELKDVTGTNYCRIFATIDERARRIVIIAAIDNLMKGASGQAVQNMNVMFHRPEQHGLL